MKNITVKNTKVSIDGDYISLTDMLRAKDGDFFISDWLRNRNTVSFWGSGKAFTMQILITANSP